MARNLDGVDDLIVSSAGALVGVGNGAVSIVILVKVNDTSKDGAVLYCGGTDLSGVSLELFSGSWYGSSQGPSMAAASTSDGWTLVAYTKAAGTVTPRFHKYVYSTGVWTHSNAGGTHDNGVAVLAGNNVQMGKWGNGAERCAVDLALGGVWSRELTDAEVEQLAYSLQSWYAAAPVESWLLDQSDISQSIRSWTGGGSAQTSITGTSVSTTSVPIFTYGHQAPILVSAASTGTSASAEAAAGTGTANDATVTTSNPRLVADRGSTQNQTSETSTLVDLAAGGSITTGNYVIARLALDNAGASGAAVTLTVTDPRSNTWTILGPANVDPGAASAGSTCYIAYTKVVNAYTNGDDLTFGYTAVSVPAKAIVVEEWANIHSVSPVVVAATTTTGTSGTPSISRTPTAVQQLFYGALAFEGPAGDTYTQDADTTDGSWVTLTSLATNNATATNNQCVRGAYKIVSGTTAQTWNPTITSRDWAQVAVVFDVAQNNISAAAGNAAGTGAANSASANVAPNAGNAAGAGTAYNPTVSSGQLATAEAATGTGAAQQPASAIAGNAAAASATGTANAASAAVKPSAGSAAGTGAANSPAPSIASSAASATATGSAPNPSTGISATASPATATGAANNATVSTAASTSASAGNASGTGAANSPAASVKPSAGVATSTGTASSPAAAIAAPAGTASASGTAYNATVTTTSSTSALAGVATGTGAAHSPAASVAAQAVIATATAIVQQAAAAIAAKALAATGAGSAWDAQVSTSQGVAFAEVATATGAAYGATVTIHGNDILRPDSGTITRPGSGGILRPYAGVVERP